jgi:hypothetical protein
MRVHLLSNCCRGNNSRLRCHRVVNLKFGSVPEPDIAGDSPHAADERACKVHNNACPLQISSVLKSVKIFR